MFYQKSIFDNRETKCIWDHFNSECAYNSVNEFNANVIVASLLLTLSIIIPLKIILILLFDGILKAPESMDTNEDGQTKDAYPKRKESTIAAGIRRASRSVLAIGSEFRNRTSTLFKKKILAPDSVKKSRLEYISSIKELKSSDIDVVSSEVGTNVDGQSSETHFYDGADVIDRMETTNVANAANVTNFKNNLPVDNPADIEAPNALSSKILSFGFMRANSNFQQKKADRIHYVFDQLIGEIRKYVNNHTNRTNHSVVLRPFVQQWDIHMKQEGEFGALNNPKYWRHKIGEAMDCSEEIIASIKDIPTDTRGAHLMRHFFIDILGRTTKEAKVFETKSQYYFGECRIVSKQIKWLATIFIILLNIFCVYQYILYGAIKGHQWQMNWITLCFCALVFLFTIEMTYEAVMISFVIPSQVLPKVRAAQAIMNSALIKYVSSIQCTQVDNNVIEKAITDFSASTYLFPSVIVASKMPDLPESEFILSYVDPLPIASQIKRQCNNLQGVYYTRLSLTLSNGFLPFLVHGLY